MAGQSSFQFDKVSCVTTFGDLLPHAKFKDINGNLYQKHVDNVCLQFLTEHIYTKVILDVDTKIDWELVE